MKIRFYSADEQGHFPIYLSTVDINHIQEKISRPNGYEMHQLFLVSSGKGIIEIDGHKTVISANDMFFIPQNYPHKYYGTSDEFKTTFILAR